MNQANTLAVNDVSFEVAKGSMVGIMGASGSGKSTLRNMIATIDKATSGGIEIDGKDIQQVSEQDLAVFRRQHLGFVFQEYNLIDTLTIYENIALALTILSLQQIIELKWQANNIRILYYLGKSQAQIKSMLKGQIMVALFLPTAISFTLLLLGTPLMNYKLNGVLPPTMHNFLYLAVGGFIVCFAVLYVCYFFIIYFVSKRYIENVIH